MKFPQYNIEFDHEPENKAQLSAMEGIARFRHENGGGGVVELKGGRNDCDGYYEWSGIGLRRAVLGWRG